MRGWRGLVAVVALGVAAPAARACAVCRPQVDATVYDAAYTTRLALVTLPVLLLVAGAVGLLVADAWRRPTYRRSVASSAPAADGIEPDAA